MEKAKSKHLRLRKGDLVRVIAGKHKGAEGKILRVNKERGLVLVENVNIVKKAQRPTQQNPRGGFSEHEAPIHVSNVSLLDPQGRKPTRVGFKFLENGEKVRVSVKSGARLDEQR